MRMSHEDISYKNCTNTLLICSFFKTLNPHNFQTNNPRKLPLVQMKELFKNFPMMYHKCQNSSISKSLKTREKKKKKVDRAQSPSPKFFWVGTKMTFCIDCWVFEIRIRSCEEHFNIFKTPNG